MGEDRQPDTSAPAIKSDAEVNADLCATPGGIGSPELLARLATITDDDVDFLYSALYDGVQRWLEMRVQHRSTDFEASFRCAAGELVEMAATVLRAMKRRQGQELSPALFAKYCYGKAELVLHDDTFNERADEMFAASFEVVPPDPEEIAREARNERCRHHNCCAVLELLATQTEPVRRPLIRRYLEEHGCLVDQDPSFPRPDWSDAVSFALRTLREEGKVHQKNGAYSLVSGSTPLLPSALSSPLASEVLQPLEVFTAEETIGDGAQLVYIYFNEAERKLARHESRDRWPCKIGFTTGRLTTRLLQQRPGTSMSRLPVVGLVIKTNDGRALEQAIHDALDQAGSRLELAVGNEWFDTSPEKIRNWYTAHQQTIAVLRT